MKQNLFILEPHHTVDAAPSGPHQMKNLVHILTNCAAYSDIRERMISEYEEIRKKTKSELHFEDILKTEKTFFSLFLTLQVSF